MILNPEIRELVDEVVREYPLLEGCRIKAKIFKELDESALCGVMTYLGAVYAVRRVIREEMRLDMQRLALLQGEVLGQP